MTDLDIAKQIELKHISSIAEKLGLEVDDIDMYGKHKAKLPHRLINHEKVKNCNLVLVTAVSPTPAGEGKTTMSIGLSEGLNQLGKQTTVVLREPSLGPVFGIKGGATGGGYSQVLPMEDINLHFTGDFSAIEKAHNLLSAVLDNNIQSKTNSLGIDARTVTWKRVMDMNDRSLRNIVIGLGGTTSGVPRQSGFDITAASEIMAILCLADDMEDLKRRLGNIFVGYTFKKEPIYAKDLKVQGAMAALLKEAVKPNLVQTIEGNPAIIHGGPFASYGSVYSAEIQAFAAAGYVVLYSNPRGSTSYGQEFGNLIHHDYPNHDYDDLMSGVDAVIEKGYIDEKNLFVTGGSGGGVLTAWIVGKTDRFKAAVVAKPVINWYSFVLYADGTPFFYKYWFPNKPWEDPTSYLKRSPLSYVGNVKTPTMLLTGEEDYRTPIAESEQFYAALKLEGVETAMVRIPGASHGIANRPSNLIAKIASILAWFEKYIFSVINL